MSGVRLIISGGQTGADQGGLHVARDLGIPTGGTAAKGWRTERGPAPWLADYGLVEASVSGYNYRTEMNVKYADGTVVFGDETSAGSRLTVEMCLKHGKPSIINPSGAELRTWCDAHDIATLNIAGNRASKAPGISSVVHRVLTEAFAVTPTPKPRAVGRMGLSGNLHVDNRPTPATTPGA